MSFAPYLIANKIGHEWRLDMKGINIYIIDSKKMIKRGLPGYKQGQEQAKTYFPSVEKDDKKYKVKIIDEKLIKELFEFISVPKEKRILDTDDCGILISIRYIKDDNYAMTIYYHPKDCYVEHYDISDYAKHESDYVLAAKIVKWINEKAL